MRRRTAIFLLLVVPLAAPAVAQVQPYRSGDASTVALNILPPGQGRYLNSVEFGQFQANGAQPSQNTDQLDLYESLVQAAPTLTAADLATYYKDASFGVRPGDVTRTYSPRSGVVIQRDTFQVPHVYGTTRSDTLFGAGYVTGEDRLFMVDTLRNLARGRISQFLGPSPANLQTDRVTRKFADYDEAELQAMLDRAAALDPVLGPIARQDILDFTAGLNAFIAEARVDATKRPAEYDALQLVPQDWKPTDSVALASLIGSQFSVGGGGQLRNALFLKELEAGHSAADARAIFDDFHVANDPEAATSTDTPFPFMEIAATQDLRGLKILPVMLRAIGTPTDPRLVAAVTLLDAWQDDGAHRRDLDGNGAYEHEAAVALMDAWWGRALQAVFQPTLGVAFDDVPIAQNQNANPGGSSYFSGWYGQLQKDLRRVLGDPVVGPFSRAYCGAGVLADCQTALLGSLDAAVTSLETQFGADPAGWNVDEEAEKISFSEVGLVGQRRMQWQDRPTFQQVLMFGGPGGACGIVPASGGRPAGPAAVLLRLSDRIPDTRDRLLWRWGWDAVTTKPDFGDPRGRRATTSASTTARRPWSRM